jgi:hypothetical protein
LKTARWHAVTANKKTNFKGDLTGNVEMASKINATFNANFQGLPKGE